MQLFDLNAKSNLIGKVTCIMAQFYLYCFKFEKKVWIVSITQTYVWEMQDNIVEMQFQK